MTTKPGAIRDFVSPPGFTRKDYVARGTNGRVFLDAASQTIVKIENGYDQYDQAAIIVERKIYERLQSQGGHHGILRYYGPYASGLRLEYASNRNLAAYLQNHANISIEQRLQWASQISSALSFVHSNSVIHGDLCLNNVFLTEDLNAKLADFGGSSIDGSDLVAIVTESHQYPGSLLCVEADLFALGSTLFEIMANRRPYHDRTAAEIESLYNEHAFPNTQSLGPIGAIITKCWQVHYRKADEVLEDIKGMHFSRGTERD